MGFLRTTAATALLAASAEAQIQVRNAGVPSPERVQTTVELEHRRYSELDAWALSTTVAWSPDAVHGFEVEVPVLRLDATVAAAGGGPSLADEATALGDVRLRVQRSLRQVDDVMESTRWAVFGELRLPTGDHEALTDAGQVLPRHLQPGAGALGLGVGGVWSWIRDRQRVSVSLAARATGERDDFRMGPELSLGAAWWYRLTPAVFDPRLEQVEVRPVVELLATQRAHGVRDGGPDPDDGGLEAWLALGVQVYARRDLLVQTSLGLPVVDEQDDPLGDREGTLLLALRWYR